MIQLVKVEMLIHTITIRKSLPFSTSAAGRNDASKTFTIGLCSTVALCTSTAYMASKNLTSTIQNTSMVVKKKKLLIRNRELEKAVARETKYYDSVKSGKRVAFCCTASALKIVKTSLKH